jgi:FkbM family methyltransferase
MAHHDFPPYQFVDFALRNVLRRVPPAPWAEHVAVWWGSRYQARPTVVRLRNGARMLVEPRDYLLIWLYYLGTFEPYCLSLLPRFLSPGGTMLDVGANLGVYTLTAAKQVGPGGRVISVEAVPTVAAALRENINRNGCSWVTVVEAAAGAGEGEAKIGKPTGSNNSGEFMVGDHGDGEGTFSVRVRTLDDILAEAGVAKVDFVKMDIEGSEFDALRGASRLLRVDRPAFVIELNEDALRRRGSSADAVVSLFREAGYSGQTVGRKGLTPLEPLGPGGCVECLFVPG